MAQRRAERTRRIAALKRDKCARPFIVLGFESDGQTVYLEAFRINESDGAQL